MILMVLGVFFLKESLGKPIETLTNSDVLDPITINVNNVSEIG